MRLAESVAADYLILGRVTLPFSPGMLMRGARLYPQLDGSLYPRLVVPTCAVDQP